jgi:hypothetical protein
VVGIHCNLIAVGALRGLRMKKQELRMLHLSFPV